MNLILLDGENFLVRYCHAMGHQQGQTQEQKSSAIISTMLKNIETLYEQNNTDLIFVAFDSGKSKYRLELYPEYKANREKNKSDEDFYKLKTGIKEEFYSSLQQAGIITMMSYGIEADDIIAYICKKFPNDRKLLVTEDKDYLQLIDNITEVFAPTKKEITTLKSILNKYPFLSPADVRRFLVMEKCIIGDTSDNVKGIFRYGPVKTLKLLEKVFTNTLDEVDKKVFLENKDLLINNKKLINLMELPENYNEEIKSSILKALEVNNSFDDSQSYELKLKHKVDISNLITSSRFCYNKYKDNIYEAIRS